MQQPVTAVDDWMSDQWYNPNAMPQNFDWQRYIGANQDLGAAGIDTQEEAMRHYFNYGQQENRNINAATPTRTEDLSGADKRAGIAAYRQATGFDDPFIITNPGDDSSNHHVWKWINDNYIPQGQFKTDYSVAEPVNTYDYLNILETSNRPLDQLANIQAAWEENKDTPGKMRGIMQEYGITMGDLSQATGEPFSKLDTWVKGGDFLGVVGFSVNRPGAYEKYRGTTTPEYEADPTFVTGPSTPESRRESFESSQRKAADTFDPLAYEKYKQLMTLGVPQDEAFTQAGLQNRRYTSQSAPASAKAVGTPAETQQEILRQFGVTKDANAPTTEGILSGFKYAKDSGVSDASLKESLGVNTFNSYKKGFADYAKTGIANVLADNQLSFDEARAQVKFGRDYGYDAQQLADLTGTDKAVFDAIYKNYDETTNRVVDSTLASADLKTPEDRVIQKLALQQKFGFNDEDLAKATDTSVDQIKGLLNPVRNFESDFKKIVSNTDSTTSEIKKFAEDARANGVISKMYGTGLGELDAKIAELEDNWKSYSGVDPFQAQRVYDQIGQQREKLGGQYYQGVFGDPKKMAATLVSKGIDTLADIGQKDKFQTTTAQAQYTANGVPVQSSDGKNFYRVVDYGEGGTENVPVDAKDVQTTFGRVENIGDAEGGYTTEFIPLTEEEQATLKDGTYQKKLGTVAIDKDTGKEIAGLDGTIASERSGKWYNRKENDLNVGFTDGGVPVLYTTKEKTGFGAALQQALPVIAMALPFILPGVGAALSSGLASVGGSTLAAGSLANAALTQGILSGGLTTLGGGKFEKGFLGGAVSPVISSGIGSLLPTGMNPNMARAITSAGTGAVSGVLQGGDFKDMLGQGVLSGLTNYGLGEATKGLNLTPQQLNFATGIAAPLLQGKKISPVRLMTTLASAAQQQTKGKTP
jgi:hypothetical protein